jgi:signal transduction histidine kinase
MDLPVHIPHVDLGRRISVLNSSVINRVLAALMLVVIVSANILIWPVPHLGFEINLQTYEITQIASGSSADQAGLQVGDRVLHVYGRPMAEALRSVNRLVLIGPRDRPVPLVLERDEQILTMALDQGEPSLEFQLSKAVLALLASICWLTGYLLGVVRRHDAPGSRLVAIFWLGMAGMLGSLTFAVYSAIPILVVWVWLIIAVFVPLSIYIHVWYPPRGIPPGVARRAGSALCVGSFLLNGSIAAWVYLTRPSLEDVLMSLMGVIQPAILVGLGGSGWVLYRAYRHMTIPHTRRQIRLIAVACLSITLLGIVLWLLPSFVIGHSLLQERWLVLLCGAVPLAYLIGGLSSDLYRVDHLAMRFLVHLATMTLLVALLVLITRHVAFQSIAATMWIAVGLIALYRPLQHGFTRLLPGSCGHHQQRALEAAMLGLTQTLDAASLVSTVVQAVRTAFGQPALAFFLGEVDGSGRLTLQQQERMPDLPPCLPPGLLTRQLAVLPSVIETRVVQQVVEPACLDAAEQRLLTHQAIVLWCPIQHQGQLLGLLVLGMREDLDPYRSEDQQALQRFIAAAALAFANSATYTRHKEAEELIRQLYQRLQSIQDATAQTIARQIHDDIINMPIRLNIESLKKLRGLVAHQMVRAEIELILETEETVIETLRTICERLYPTAIDDPHGLPAVLRLQVEKLQARWEGDCQLQITGQRLPIPAAVQREALRITQEALANAVQHADATSIIVHLQYPATPAGQIRLSIADNGPASQEIAPRPGHWGVRSMQENARVIGGQVIFQREVGVGTTVMLTFPAHVDQLDHQAQE